jgi:cellulose biosynthesis protein BcsQ
MMESKGQPDQNETPEDVATLYSWANLHGAKYRDFSAARAQTREKARERVEQAIEEEKLRARQASEPQRQIEAARAQEEARKADLAAQQAGLEAARQAALQSQAVQQAARDAQQELARRVAQQAAQPSPWEPQRPERYAPPSDPQPETPSSEVRRSVPESFTPPPYRPAESQAPNFAMREESYTPPRQSWTNQAHDPRESAPRPAWLTPDRTESPQSQPPPPTPPAATEDTLQGSRDRLASRWYALQGIFEGGVAPTQSAPAPTVARAPVMAVFSLAGGVGKTSLVATLGRALSARGERVLLVDTAAYGLMPFFFGARDQRPGLLRTFSPPLASGDAPIQMITLDPEILGPETAAQEPLTIEISTHARGVGRVIVDLATASGATTRRVLRLNPQVLVPLVPDMSSVVSVSSIDAFFQRNYGTGKLPLPHYVLNQFDPSLPLHLDIREVLREQLGDRLLPFVLRHAPAVSEALAEGMTIMDYAPNSAVVEDFVTLAGWVKSLSAPAITGFRGVRWSER